MTLKAALAAEFRRHQAGWSLWGSCRDQYNSQVSSTPKAARCYAGQCLTALILVGGSHSIFTWAATETPAPSLPCRFPCSPEVVVFRQLRSDGSFRQEPLQLLIPSVLFLMLSHRTVKKTCSFWSLSRLSPSLNSSPEVVPSTWLGSS